MKYIDSLSIHSPSLFELSKHSLPRSAYCIGRMGRRHAGHCKPQNHGEDFLLYCFTAHKEELREQEGRRDGRQEEGRTEL